MNFWIIENDSDSTFIRIAATEAKADEIRDWFNANNTQYPGTYSHSTVNVTDTQLQNLYRHASIIDCGEGGPWT